MQKASYKCFIREVIDNLKRRLLYQTVGVHSRPDLVWDAGRVFHTDELKKASPSPPPPPLLGKRNQAFVFSSLGEIIPSAAR